MNLLEGKPLDVYFRKIIPHKSEHCGTNSKLRCKTFWLRVVHSFGGFLTRKKLAFGIEAGEDLQETCFVIRKWL